MPNISVVVIHGGEPFDSYDEYLHYLETRTVTAAHFNPRSDWKARLPADLGSGFKVFLPRMPNGQNAKFREWSIWLSRLAPLLDEEVIFVGESLGGTFIAKELSRQWFPRKVLATILVAAPFTDEGSPLSLATFKLPSSLEPLGAQGGKIHIFHSEDDPVIPRSHAGMYQRALPGSKVHLLERRGHFNIESFPEIVSLIRVLARAYA